MREPIRGTIQGPDARVTRVPSAMARQVAIVGGGVAVLALTSFGYLSVAGRVLGPADLIPLTTLWILVNAVGPALFLPFEQEIGRAVAARRAVGLGAWPVFSRTAVIAVALLAALAIACAAAGAPLSSNLFEGHPVVLLAFVLGSAGLCAGYLVRGALAGNGDFGRYGVQLGVDGVLRLAGAVALAAAASTTVESYALVLGLAPVLAVLLTTPRPRRFLGDGPPAPWRDLGPALGLLVAGTVCAQFVVNAAPIAANLLAEPDEQAALGIFLTAYVLMRVPLLGFAAVQAALLPGMARLAAVGDRAGFVRRLQLILLLVGGLGLAGLLTVAAIGPWAVRLAFGAEFVTTRADLLPLATATATYMVALVLAQVLISLRSYRGSLLGWAVGSLAFLLALLVPRPLEQRVGLAYLAAAAVAAGILTVALVTRLRAPMPGGQPAPGEVATGPTL